MSLVNFLRGRRVRTGQGAFALALALSALGTAATPKPPAWNAQGAAQQVLTVEPSQVQSLCMPLRANQRVVWAFVAQAPLDFDLQFNDGSRLVPSARRQGVQEARDQLDVAQTREHCWIWRNRGEQPVQVSVQLRRR